MWHLAQVAGGARQAFAQSCISNSCVNPGLVTYVLFIISLILYLLELFYKYVRKTENARRHINSFPSYKTIYRNA